MSDSDAARLTLTVSSRLEVTGLPEDLAQRFRRENTFPNPKFELLERLGKWTAGTPSSLQLYREDDGRLILPRGYLPAVIAELRQAGINYHLNDLTTCPTFNDQLEAKGQLYPYQESALSALLYYRSGVLEAPTGCGKTNILLSAVARLQTSALILVHTRELLEQTAERCRQWLGIEPGILGGGKRNLERVTIATVQTLARMDLADCGLGIADYFGAVLVDECHHSPALTWARILEQLPARHRYGFTATAWRKDGLQFLLWRVIGNKTATITRRQVEEAGKIVWPTVEAVPTNFYFDYRDDAQWGDLVSALARDPARNELIVRTVLERLRGDTRARALVLTDRIEHAELLAEDLAAAAPVLLTGNVPLVQRRARMKQVRAGARLTIATLQLLGEGVDVPGWDLLFLVSPIAGGPRTLQAVGRVARSAPGKTRATVVDFVDERVQILCRAFEKRQRLYAAA